MSERLDLRREVGAEAVPCRTCGAAAGEKCRSRGGRVQAIAHQCRKADRRVLGRDPETTARELDAPRPGARAGCPTLLDALRLIARAGRAERRIGGFGHVRGSGGIGSSTMFALEEVGAIEPVGAGWIVTDFGRRVVEARGAA